VIVPSNLAHFRRQLVFAQKFFNAAVDLRQPGLELLERARQFGRRRNALTGIGFKVAGKAFLHGAPCFGPGCLVKAVMPLQFVPGVLHPLGAALKAGGFAQVFQKEVTEFVKGGGGVLVLEKTDKVAAVVKLEHDAARGLFKGFALAEQLVDFSIQGGYIRSAFSEKVRGSFRISGARKAGVSVSTRGSPVDIGWREGVFIFIARRPVRNLLRIIPKGRQRYCASYMSGFSSASRNRRGDDNER
jgi:hypothetical protein